ncbi:MAG: tetratricopeptide repeat protein [Terriglobales bacterium]
MRRQISCAAGLAVVLMSLSALTAAAQQTYSSNAPPKPEVISLSERGEIYLAERKYDEAVAVLQTALQQHQQSAVIYNELAIAYQQLGNLGAAEKYYKKAVKKDKKRARYRNNLGTAYYMKHKWKDAGKQFRQAIKLNPNKAAYYVNLGGVLFVRKKYKQAITALRDALVLDPNALFPAGGSGPIVQDVQGANTAEFHYDLARLFCSMGMLNEAVHEFSQAYDLHYAKLKASLTDPVFAPLRTRPEYRTLMGLPPLPPPTLTPHGQG